MSKLVTGGRRHNRKASNSPYEELGRTAPDDHPIDRAIEARLQHAALNNQIRRLQEKVLHTLGRDSRAMLDLEALRNDERIEREAAYFDLGYEHGFAAKQSRLQRCETDDSARCLARKVTTVVMNENVPSAERALALADALWVMLRRFQRSDVVRQDRRRRAR